MFNVVNYFKDLKKLTSFFKDIKKEGILLYHNKEFQLFEPKELDDKEAMKIAKEDFEQWFESGEGFLRDSKYTLKIQDHKKSAFYLHQATESFLTCHLLVLTSYRPKTHNLEELLSLCSNQSNEFLNIFPKNNSNQQNKTKAHRITRPDQIEILYNSKNKADWFELLKMAYIESRYSKYYKITEEQLKYLIKKVEYLQEVTKKVCKKRMG